MLTFIILQYFQTKYNFHAVLREDQLIKLRGIFKPEKMKIRPSVIKLPEQLSINWETVGGRDDEEGVKKKIFYEKLNLNIMYY